jgi:hypothetical protein
MSALQLVSISASQHLSKKADQLPSLSGVLTS